jgi:hypothetical protein
MLVYTLFQICSRFLTRNNPWAVNSNALYNLHPPVLVLSSGYRNIRRQDGLEPNKDSIRIEQSMAAILAIGI